MCVLCTGWLPNTKRKKVDFCFLVIIKKFFFFWLEATVGAIIASAMPLRLYAHPLFKSERESLFFFFLLDVGQRLRMEHSWAGCHGVGRHHGPSTPTQQQQHTKAKKSWHYYILAFFLLFSTALPNQKKKHQTKIVFFSAVVLCRILQELS